MSESIQIRKNFLLNNYKKLDEQNYLNNIEQKIMKCLTFQEYSFLLSKMEEIKKKSNIYDAYQEEIDFVLGIKES